MADESAKAWLAGVFDRAAATYDGPGGGYHDEFGERLVNAAGVEAGDRVLDVACGRGAVLAPVARAVGDRGRVLGIDLSAEMVRLAAARVEQAETAVMDAEQLDLADGSFDRVLCAFGIFFLPDPERAVAGFHRVLAATGTVALSTWGAEDPRWDWENELLADIEVDRRAVRRPFDQASDLEELLEGAGFDDVRVEASHLEVRLSDPDEWWAWKWSYSFRGVLEQLPDARVERLRAEAGARLEAMDQGDGLPIRLEALFAVGRR